MARKRGVRRISEYGRQLQEKQKVKREYGVREKQFRFYYEKASKNEVPTGTALLVRLELRLDNVLYRSGIFKSRAQARQAITHGHIQLNGVKVDIPSYQMKIGDKFKLVKEDLFSEGEQEVASWLKINQKKLEGELTRLPEREEISQDFNEQLIVEFYSR